MGFRVFSVVLGVQTLTQAVFANCKSVLMEPIKA